MSNLMARGGRPGKKRTQYVRDAQGQFASTPGGGKKATPSAVRKAAKAAAVKGKGSLATRTSLKRSSAKLAAIDKADETLKASLSRRAQKGAVTRGQKAARAAIKSSRTKLNIAPKTNTIKKSRTMREMSQIVKDATPKVSGGKGKVVSARGKVRSAANPKVAPLPPTSERRKPLKGAGEVVGRNLAGFTGIPVEIRSRKQAAVAQRSRGNQLGKKAASSKGFNDATTKRQSFADSAPRIVVGRKKIRQFTLFGGVKTMGAGKFRDVGIMTSGGRVFRPSKPAPLSTSKAGRRETKRRADAGDPWAIAAMKKWNKK